MPTQTQMPTQVQPHAQTQLQPLTHRAAPDLVQAAAQPYAPPDPRDAQALAAPFEAPAARARASTDEPAYADFDAPPAAALLPLDQGRTLLLCADDGPFDARRRAARAIRAAALASAPDLASLQASLLALNQPLYGARAASAGLVEEDGAVLIARFEAGEARLMRFGAALAWHWRHGQLRPLFVERAAGAGGEFDDLLFGSAWLALPGLGAAGVPHHDEARIVLEAGDRLLLLVTRQLMELPQAQIAAALGLPTCAAAREQLAVDAGLVADLMIEPAQWPLAVLGVEA